MWCLKHSRQCFIIGMSKHREQSWKYEVQRVIFDETRARVLDISWYISWYISLKLYLNSLVYHRNIFGSSSKVFSNLRKFSENVRERSYGLRNNFEKSEILFLPLEIKFKSSRHRIISYVSCTSTSRYSLLHNNKAIFDYSDFFQTITIHNPEDRDYQIIDCCQSIAFDKEFCSEFDRYWFPAINR